MDFEIISKTVDNFSGAAGLATSMVLLLKPMAPSSHSEEEVKERTNEFWFEIALFVLAKMVPLWGFIIGFYWLLAKSMEADEFFEEEKENNLRSAFIIGIVAETVSVAFFLIN